MSEQAPSTFVDDFNKQEKYMPGAMQIAASIVIRPASRLQDMSESTDILIDGKTCGIRCRDSRYMDQYKNQITLRIRTSNGGGNWEAALDYVHNKIPSTLPKSELQKYLQGYMALMIYGYATDAGLWQYWQHINMDAMRPALVTAIKSGHGFGGHWGIRTNPDRSQFLWVDMSHPAWSSYVIVNSDTQTQNNLNRWLINGGNN